MDFQLEQTNHYETYETNTMVTRITSEKYYAIYYNKMLIKHMKN